MFTICGLLYTGTWLKRLIVVQEYFFNKQKAEMLTLKCIELNQKSALPLILSVYGWKSPPEPLINWKHQIHVT